LVQQIGAVAFETLPARSPGPDRDADEAVA
jgi:hypothetical protein